MPNLNFPSIHTDEGMVETHVKDEVIKKGYGSDCVAVPDTDTDRDGSVWLTKYIHLKDSRELICGEINNSNAGISAAGKDELKVFNAIANAVKNNSIDDAIDIITGQTGLTKQDCIQNILAIAKNEFGAPYDYNFTFLTFKNLSCVEFVWYCYKSLYILHNVKRRFFYYFNFLKTCVIVPDSFIGSNFFDVIYTTYKDDSIQSSPGHKDYKKELIASFRKKHFNIWRFICTMLLLEIVLMALVCIGHSFYK
jgi:hypothetical protein